MSNAENFRRFSYDLDEWAKKMQGRAVLFAKKVAFMVLGGYILTPEGRLIAHAGLLQLTPVDTGRAVGNWMVAVGTPDRSTVDEGFGAKGGGEAARTASANAATRRAQGRLAGFRIGQSIWINNSLPYIVVLNDGGQNRTAHHMMERSLDNTKRALAAGSV